MAAEDAQKSGGATKSVIRNIGLLLSGDLGRPVLEGDAIVAVDGRIAGVGRLKDLDAEGATTVVSDVPTARCMRISAGMSMKTNI